MAEPSPVWADPGPGHRQDVYRGRAPVRRAHRPRLSDTADLPAVDPTPPPPPRRDGGRPHDQLPRGMVVRRRWRRLRAGAGWSWAGLTFVVICWGIWAVSVRGTDLISPVIGLALVLLIGALLFVVSRLLGRAVWERTLGRDRPSAWPSHLVVGGFWAMAGFTFLQQTWWIRDAWRWLGDGWRQLGDAWDLLAGVWPF